MVTLKTSNCEITSDDLKCILDSLVHVPFSYLEYWDLSLNKIDDDGVDALIGHLPRLFLKDVRILTWYGPKLDGNPVNLEMMQRLEEAKMRHIKVRFCVKSICVL